MLHATPAICVSYATHHVKKKDVLRAPARHYLVCHWKGLAGADKEDSHRSVFRRGFIGQVLRLTFRRSHIIDSEEDVRMLKR